MGEVQLSDFVLAFSVEADVEQMVLVIFLSPFLIERVEHGWCVLIPAVSVSAFGSYLLQTLAWNTIAVADEWFAVLQVVESCPQGCACRVFYQCGVAVR